MIDDSMIRDDFDDLMIVGGPAGWAVLCRGLLPGISYLRRMLLATDTSPV